MRQPIHTKDSLIKLLILFYETNNRVPVEREFTKRYNLPSKATYRKVFGKIRQALIIAGLPVPSEKHPSTFVSCANCGKTTRKQHKDLIKTENSFCSHSCSAIYNNKKDPKRKCIDPQDLICTCGHKKDRAAQTCYMCKRLKMLEQQNSRKLSDIEGKGNARVKWSQVRSLAKRTLEFSNIEKKCKICGFSFVIEACHIKPISSFSSDSLVGEINSLENLVYLCPNHHAMLDKNLINLESLTTDRGLEPAI